MGWAGHDKINNFNNITIYDKSRNGADFHGRYPADQAFFLYHWHLKQHSTGVEVYAFPSIGSSEAYLLMHTHKFSSFIHGGAVNRAYGPGPPTLMKYRFFLCQPFNGFKPFLCLVSPELDTCHATSTNQVIPIGGLKPS